MLKHFKLLAGLVLFLSVSPASAAAYKCTDMKGKNITYATQPCDELGLTSAGTVKDTVTVMPATPVEKTSEKASEKGSQQMINEDSGEDAVRKDSAIKPINPLIQKMLDW